MPPRTLASRRERIRHTLLAAASALAASGCTTTSDSIGRSASDDAASPPPLQPLDCPGPLNNPMLDALGVTPEDVSARLQAAFTQLFYGNPDTEAIYFPIGDTMAYMFDVLHADIRSEGQSFGMLITVELDRREEFDRLWTYASERLRIREGAQAGYYRSICDSLTGSVPCTDSYGLQQLATALLLAHERWGSSGGQLDYQAEAATLLSLLRGGASAAQAGVFDTMSALVVDDPDSIASGFTRPAAVMPAYYELWAQATGDAFWSEAASAGRAYWARVAHPTTGLMPIRAYFDGQPVVGWDYFGPEGYRAQWNQALDSLWSGTSTWQVEQSDRLLAFFAARGLATYGGSYELDGTLRDATRDDSLVIANGLLAAATSSSQREPFLRAVWELEVPTGQSRYYAGLYYLTGLMMLSGQFTVCHER